MTHTFFSLFIVLAGYLVGSICSAVIVCRVFALPDPRTEGSQNPGATNVLRLAGKPYALVVLLADLLKGALPVALASALNLSPLIIGLTGFAAVFGHLYPVFFQFKGGKGVATMLGVYLSLSLFLGLSVIFTWLLIACLSRYSSLSSMVSAACAPLFAISLGLPYGVLLPLVGITALVLYKHRHNWSRLRQGTEPKIGAPKI